MAVPDSLFLIRKLFEHDCWANQSVAEALGQASDPPPRALRYMTHIIGAEWLWHSRLTNSPAKFAVWPELTAHQCAAELPKLEGAWRAYLEGADVMGAISYVTSKGDHFTTGILDVLTHIPMHSHYHRGQIAAAMRESGLAPLTTDYTHWARSVRQR